MIFPVSERKYQALLSRMERLGVREADIEEDFSRGSGPGGQSVNKTSTCVQLHHRPTGIRVRCQNERSQAMNRYRARCLLLERIEAQQLGSESAAAREVAKRRRQKARRSRRSKSKMVADKRHRATIKSGRGPVGSGE